MNKVGWPDFFLRPNAIGSGGATGDHGGEGRGRSFPPSSVWAGMGASVARGSRVTSHKEPRARFFPVTVMGWRRRPSCLSPCRLTQFPRYFPFPSPLPIFLVLGLAWKGSIHRDDRQLWDVGSILWPLFVAVHS